MQPPPVQFDIPPSSHVAESPLPRLKWVWVLFGIFFALLISTSLYTNDKRQSPIKDQKKFEEKSIEIQLCTKSLKGVIPDETSGQKVRMFEEQVDNLLEKARKEPYAQKLRIVLRQEDGDKPYLDDIRNLAKSKSKEDQAFAKLYSDPKPNKQEAMALLKQLDNNEISERIAMVQTKEAFGDKDIREATFNPQQITGIAIAGVFAVIGLGIGMGAWLYYYIQRQGGKLAPKGLPLGNIDWGRADRLVFVSLLIIGTYILSSTIFATFFRRAGSQIELFVYVPIFVVMYFCTKIPIFGWRITPQKLGLSLKDFGKHVGWAVSAFFANIPVLLALVLVTSVLVRFLPGGGHPASEELLNNPSTAEILKILFLASVVAPIWEEFFFRGLLFPAFTKAFGRPLYGALMSSFIFASIHPQGAQGVPVLMAIAMMLCAVSYQTKSLVANMILHGLHNAATLGAALLLAPYLR